MIDRAALLNGCEGPMKALGTRQGLLVVEPRMDTNSHEAAGPQPIFKWRMDGVTDDCTYMTAVGAYSHVVAAYRSPGWSEAEPWVRRSPYDGTPEGGDGIGGVNLAQGAVDLVCAPYNLEEKATAVIPLKKGIQTRGHANRLVPLDLRLRGDDGIGGGGGGVSHSRAGGNPAGGGGGVIPAQAGIQQAVVVLRIAFLDLRLRGDDGGGTQGVTPGP